MPKVIRGGRLVDDPWFPVDAEEGLHGDHQILTLEQWEGLSDRAGSAVQLEPDHSPAPLLPYLEQLALVAINFPVHTDGRGFSYGRELRESGYRGELRAVGHFIRDQLHYLMRCGFDSFQMADETQMDEALASLDDFDEHYQAGYDQPLPLFRRRA
jgi:uncharacterized protein (DUF934 family)